MTPVPTIRFDKTRFLKEFRERVARSRRSLPEVVNTTAYWVNRRAMRATKRAVRLDIEKLGVMAEQIRKRPDKKTGSLRLKNRKVLYDLRGAMRAIVLGRMHKAGVDPRSYTTSAIETKVTKAIAARLRAIGFLASGFVVAVRTLARLLKLPKEALDAAQKGKAKGGVTPATDGWNPRCEFFNAALSPKDSGPGGDARARQIVEAAFGEGFDQETAHMEEYVRDRHAKIWN